jgi:3-deoxy-D-manno-octulosonate 8-phosphate phosphatase (KDO 8-P phosphatase)
MKNGGRSAPRTPRSAAAPGAGGPRLPARPRAIKALFMDVDGCLTDGLLYIDDHGREFKTFDTKDGHGVKMAIAAGLKVAWISGRRSGATLVRARDLGVRAVLQRVEDKRAIYEQLRRRWGLDAAETAGLGDDLPDLDFLSLVGFSACPADATEALRSRVDRVLKNRGGHGAVREFVEAVLAQNRKAAGDKDRSLP